METARQMRNKISFKKQKKKKVLRYKSKILKLKSIAKGCQLTFDLLIGSTLLS